MHMYVRESTSPKFDEVKTNPLVVVLTPMLQLDFCYYNHPAQYMAPQKSIEPPMTDNQNLPLNDRMPRLQKVLNQILLHDKWCK